MLRRMVILSLGGIKLGLYLKSLNLPRITKQAEPNKKTECYSISPDLMQY